MAEVILKNVSKVYDEKIKAVKNVNLTINDKEFAVLVGPSGCGKTTTLRMIAGLEEISEGEIYIDGKLINNVSPKERDIAMVFQNYALYPHMTVFENMAFGLKLRKFSKEEIRTRVTETAGILDLSDYLDRKPKALSGGQRQRVAVGRAIVRKPKVFLFDEPLSNLDAKLRVQMRTEISKLHKRLDATIIYVTHDQVEAMTMGSKIVVMKDGIVQQVDEPLSLYNKPVNKFVAGFIGSPAMNFIEAEISGTDDLKLHLKNTSHTIKLPDRYKTKLKNLSGKKIIIGIRPEDIHINHGEGNYSSLDVNLEVIEPMGYETFIYFMIGGIQFTGRVNSDALTKKNDIIKVYLDIDKFYYFDIDKLLSI